MKTILTALFQLFTNATSPTGLFVSTATVAGVSLWTVFDWINDQMALLLTKMDALTAGSFAGSLNVAPFGLMNTFVPLSEALSYFAAFLGVLGACAVIRIVKSFVPTVAT